MWSRRRRKVHVVELAPPPDESVRILRPREDAAAADQRGFSAASAVARIEKFVGAANASLQQLEDRLTHLESITQQLTEKLHGRPTHGDLLEVRLRGARTDAELHRLATELRGEIDEIKEAAETRSSGAAKQAEAS